MSDTSSNSSGPVTRSMSRRSSLCSSIPLSSSSLSSSIPLGGSASSSSVCTSSRGVDYVKVSGGGFTVYVIKN